MAATFFWKSLKTESQTRVRMNERMRQILKRLIPGPLRRVLARILSCAHEVRVYRLIALGFKRDMRRYVRQVLGTRSLRFSGKSHAQIMMAVHSIEKGLSLPSTRVPFGLRNVLALQKMLDRHAQRYGVDHVYDYGVGAIAEYCRFHRRALAETDPNMDSIRKIEEWAAGQAHRECVPVGTQIVKREDILRSALIDPAFFTVRHSVRHFSARPVELQLLRQAVEWAGKSPSVCNRQCWRVKIIQAPELIRMIQEIAGGARGFGETAPAMIVVTGDLRCFFNAEERNQVWVDSGIFTMSLLYALHALGLAACCLNCCLKPDKERRLRALLQVPAHEVFIVRIAVGHYREEFTVACSPRHPVDHYLTVYDDRGEISIQRNLAP